jgi:hypothetical protein
VFARFEDASEWTYRDTHAMARRMASFVQSQPAGEQDREHPLRR